MIKIKRYGNGTLRTSKGKHFNMRSLRKLNQSFEVWDTVKRRDVTQLFKLKIEDSRNWKQLELL